MFWDCTICNWHVANMCYAVAAAVYLSIVTNPEMPSIDQYSLSSVQGNSLIVCTQISWTYFNGDRNYIFLS